jgi:hypothetical protein
MPVKKVSFSAKLWTIFVGKIIWVPSAKAKEDMARLFNLLNEHSALYESNELEYAGAVAGSILKLRKELKKFKTKEPFVLQTAGTCQAACAEFQNRIEHMSREYAGSKEAIYDEELNILDLQPPFYGFAFARELGGLRVKIGDVLNVTSKKSRVKVPGGISKLLG